MGNAALKYDSLFGGSAFDNDTAFDNGVRPLPVTQKYHASFYDAAPYDEAVGAMAYRVRREVAAVGVRSGETSAYVADRRADRDVDRSRPNGGSFEHRSRVGVSRAVHHPEAAAVGVRSMVLGVVVTALVVLGLAGLAAVSAGSVPVPEGATDVVRVAAGETLSDIAGSVAPGQSVGLVIERIMDLNAMSDSKLNVGQTLIVPAVQGR